MLLDIIASVLRIDQQFVLNDANPRTGKRDRGGSLKFAQVEGPYGRDIFNDDGKHLVHTAADTGVTIANTVFPTFPKGG